MKRRVFPAAMVLAAGMLVVLSTMHPFSQHSSPDRFTRLQSFLEQEVEFDQYVFPPGPFPAARWKDPGAVEVAVGKIPLSIEFFDSTFQQVSRADRPGRYSAVVRGKTVDGFTVVRYVTLYCADADMHDYGIDVPVSVNPLPGFSIPKTRWDTYADNLRRFSFGSLLVLPRHDPDIAVFLAGLSGLDSARGRMETPRVNDRQWWVEFKRRNDGRAHPRVALPLPLPVDVPAPTLGEARSAERGETGSEVLYSRKDLDQIMAACSSWADSTGVPFVALVARRGEVIFHQAFGKTDDGMPMRIDTPTWMASISKLLTGVLVMQCADRGLVDLDAPIDRYLPEFSSPTSSGLTLRLLMTHTAGLGWVGEWASDWEPSTENRLAQAQPHLKVNETFKYHRSGYALAGKVLERITGLAVPYLFDRLLLAPLSMSHSFIDNTYGGLYATALDVARLGQMLLNEGQYGETRFFSPKSFREMLPRPLPLKAGPGTRVRSWGIGTAPLGGHGLSTSAFGHEAASGAILRIDPEREMVVVVGRNEVGPDYRQYERFVDRFLRAVSAPAEQEATRE